MSFNFARDPFWNLDDQLMIAEQVGVKEPTAMSLATASKSGLPSVRAVLFKGIVRRGLSFYTNTASPKAHDLHENPQAEVLFYWSTLYQQIRISGCVEKLLRKESEEYFALRPRFNQMASWASDQSQIISSYDELTKKVEELDWKFHGDPVPCRPHWGGYILVPNRFEFWFGKEGRLHERYVYSWNQELNNWDQYMLSP